MLAENVKYCRKIFYVQIMSKIQNSKFKIQNLKTAVVGVGSLGRHHARNYAEIAGTGEIELIGVCDANEETAREIATENDCNYFTDWRELLNITDAVSIATPTTAVFKF